MNATCGRLVIAGTGSGVGKTSIALGLVRALRRRGHRVQPLKVGPDFLDPTYLTLSVRTVQTIIVARERHGASRR